MADRLYVGVDLGGTNVRSGLVDREGMVLSRDERPTKARESAEAPLQQIVDSVRETVKKGGVTLDDVSGIGIGSPGPLNARTGTILHAGNLPHWYDFPLCDKLTERLGPPSSLQNDATLFAYGEWWKGAGRDCDDFYAITLGTGIGGGAVCGGKLLTGFNDNASEIGHMSIDYNGPQCWCGQKGCLEKYASATGFVAMTLEELKNEHVDTSLAEYRGKPGELTSHIIYDAAVAGDAFARRMFEYVGYLLGIGLVNVLNLVNYEKLAVGGGLAKAGDYILDPVRRALHDRGFQSYVDEVKIVPAELPDVAAILGAVKLVIDRERND